MTHTNFVRCLFALAILSPLACADDPSALLAEVKSSVPKPGVNNIPSYLAKLERANALWEQQNSTSPEYAESIEYYLLYLNYKEPFLGLDAPLDPASPALQSKLSLIDKAIDMAKASSQPVLLAQALEIKAEILGQNGVGASFWSQAQDLRKQIVASLPDSPPPATHNPIPDASAPAARLVPPQLSSKVEPNYPQFARLRKKSGRVLLSLVISKEGVPVRIRLVRGIGFGLDEEAVRAVQQWRFRAGVKNGEAVAVQSQIEVSFHLL